MASNFDQTLLHATEFAQKAGNEVQNLLDSNADLALTEKLGPADLRTKADLLAQEIIDSIRATLG